MSQPPKARSLSAASGTKSWIFGTRRSVRLPSRMVPSCVSDPIGCAIFLLIASTPAMNVVLTAPMPGIRTPSFPDGASILRPFCTTFPPVKPEQYITNLRCLLLSPLRGCHSSSLARFRACSPIGKQEIAIHSGNHFQTDFLRANGFAFANIGAAPEHLLFDLRHHI